MLTVQFKVAEQFSQLIRQYPSAIPTAYSDDYGADWTHLILTYVIQVCYAPCCASIHWAGPWEIWRNLWHYYKYARYLRGCSD